MCVIGIGPASALLKTVSDCFSKNRDGAGVAVLVDKKLTVYKGLMSEIEVAGVLGQYGDILVAVHYRLATHGAVTVDNTHPFQLDDKTALMHNGIIRGLGSHGHNGISDSAELAGILAELSRGSRHKLLGAMDGRFCLIDAESNSYHYFGDFQEHDNCKYSNLHWKAYSYVSEFTGKDWRQHDHSGTCGFGAGRQLELAPKSYTERSRGLSGKKYLKALKKARRILGLPEAERQAAVYQLTGAEWRIYLDERERSGKRCDVPIVGEEIEFADSAALDFRK